MDSLCIRRAAVFCVLLAGPALAQSSKFAQGDRVEVRDRLEWKKGTVLSIDDFSGWVDVRIDESEDEQSQIVSPRVRKERLTRHVPASSVRPSMETPVAGRTWTDRTGKFKVKAQYGGVEGDSVILIRAGGKQVKVPLAKLSEQDQQFVKLQSAEEANPFGEPDDVEIASSVMKQAVWRGARQVQPQTFDTWTFKPQTKSESMIALEGRRDVEVRLANLPDSQKFFEEVHGIYVSSDGNRIIVCRKTGNPGSDEATYLQEIDVVKQRGKSVVALPPETAVLDVAPEQNLIMYRPDISGFGQNTLLTIARLEGDQLVPVTSWEPYAAEDFDPSKDVEKAWFLGPDRVMSINRHGRALTVWDGTSTKALLNIPVGVSFSLKMALSPDRSLLGIVMENGVAIIDLAAGRHVATVEAKGSDIAQVQFRADNGRLAAISGHGVTVWDLATGERLNDFASMGGRFHGNLTWAGEFLLAESRYLYDVERRILLWEYQGDSQSATAATMHNGRLYVIPRNWNDDGDTRLVSAALPHRSALDLAKQLPSPEELLVVKPGDEVQLEVDIDSSVVITDDVQKQLKLRFEDVDAEGADAANIIMLQPGAAQNDLIRQALITALQDAGFKVVEKSDLVVNAVCKPQPQQTIKINVDGRWPPRPEDFQEHTITPHASYLEMTYKGEELWKRGFVARPFMTIWMEKGETLPQALQRLTQPNLAIFTQSVFSPYVAKPGKATPNGAYGVSQFTARGIVDGGGSGNGRLAFE